MLLREPLLSKRVTCPGRCAARLSGSQVFPSCFPSLGVVRTTTADLRQGGSFCVFNFLEWGSLAVQFTLPQDLSMM